MELGWTLGLALRGIVCRRIPSLQAKEFPMQCSRRHHRRQLAASCTVGWQKKGTGGVLSAGSGNVDVRPGQLLQEGDSDFHACRHTQMRTTKSDGLSALCRRQKCGTSRRRRLCEPSPRRRRRQQGSHRQKWTPRACLKRGAWQQVLAAENVLSAVGLFAGDRLGVGSKEDGTNQAETKVADGFSKWRLARLLLENHHNTS